MARVVLLVWLLVVAIALVQAQWDIRQSLGTKSPYWSEGSTAVTPPPNGCSAIHINLLSRHGSRYPTNGDVEDLDKLESKIKKYKKYINSSYAYIKSWTNPYPVSEEGFLSLTGQQELFGLAQRFNASYYPLLAQPYAPDVYQMQSTQIPRAGVSASSFAQGFLQGQGGLGNSHFQPPYIYSNSLSLDYLRFFDNCAVYTEAMDNGTINKNEADSYKAEQYPPIAARVQEALGVGLNWNVSKKDVDAMLTACAFEVAVFDKYDGWCPLFSPADIDVFAYIGDLEDYWERSYGSEFGYKISSVILQDIVTTMQGVIAKNSSDYEFQKGYFRFGHAEDIIPMTTLLGLFKSDYPLTANLSQSQIQSRTWSGSVISPFSANLAFILYECSGDTYRVKLTHNEVEYTFPGCDDLFCPFDQFTSIYASALAFNFTEACTPPAPLTTPRTATVSMLVFSIAVVVAFAAGANIVLIFAVAYFRKNKFTHAQTKYGPLNP